PGRTPSSRYGNVTAPRRGKTAMGPWLDLIRVPWQAAFLPVSQEGPEQRQLGISEALKRTPEEGGWVHDRRPSVVTFYDPTSPAHRKLLDGLDLDARFRAATHLFNCFRVARSAGAPGADAVELVVYDA